MDVFVTVFLVFLVIVFVGVFLVVYMDIFVVVLLCGGVFVVENVSVVGLVNGGLLVPRTFEKHCVCHTDVL